MKKHFLLLLMAFMSISAWAIDVDVLWAPTTYYGTVPAYLKVYTASGVEVAETNYDFNGYFKDAACSISATAAEVRAADAGTTFYLKVTGKNGFEGSPTTSFTIAAMPLTVTVADASKKYLANDPASFTIDAIEDVNSTDVKTALAASMTVVRETGDVVKYDTEGNVIGYSYTATSTNPNYTVTATNGTFTIEPRDFKSLANEGTITVEASGYPTYNGAAQLPTTITVTDKKDTETTLTLVKDVDFTVTGSSNIAASDAAKVIVKGKGNYAETTVEATFTINPAPLLVTPNPTKVYDGVATMPDAYEGAFSYQGFVDDKTAADVTETTGNIDWALATGVTASANVGEYDAVITNTEGFSLDNYRFVAQPGKFKITEKETVKVTATSYTGDDAIEFGAAENFGFTLGDLSYFADDEDALKAAIIVRKSATAGEDGKYTLTPDFMTDAEIDAAYTGEANADKRAAAKAAAKNYKLLEDNITVGKLQYKNAALMIALKESAYEGLTKVYDGQPVSVTLNKESGLIISPATATVDLDELTLTVVDNSANVGTYRLELSGAKATNYDITYIPSQYKITQRPLSVNIYDQTFVKATVPALNADLFTVADPGEGTGLVTGEEAGDVFKLALDKTEYYTEAVAALAEGDPTPADYKEFVGADAAGATLTATEAGNYNTAAHLPAAAGDKKRDGVIAVDADGKISATVVPGNFANAIIAIAASEKFANYNIIPTNGKAVILGEAIVLSDAAAITTTAQDGATVNFSARSLQTEKWNPLVLPFKISVEDLSKAFGYAVIDVLNKDKGTDGNVYFKLKVSGDIDANTPFLIYPSDSKTDLNQVVFTGVNVVAVTGEENVSVSDAGGNTFWGTYKSTPIYGQNFRYMSKGTWYDARNYDATTPANIKPLRGYLELPEANAPRAIIFIEEPDGTTTAIKAITGDKIGSDISTDGWYTIGGVKLQGAPTQKGIYINKGKKVVVR